MRLLTRQEISTEFRIPLDGVDSRMSELGVEAYAPVKKGRGYHVLYDADEIILALRNEREVKIAKKQKRVPRLRHKNGIPDIFSMPWSQAEKLLTASSPRQ